MEHILLIFFNYLNIIKEKEIVKLTISFNSMFKQELFFKIIRRYIVEILI